MIGCLWVLEKPLSKNPYNESLFIQSTGYEPKNNPKIITVNGISLFSDFKVKKAKIYC